MQLAPQIVGFEGKLTDRDVKCRVVTGPDPALVFTSKALSAARD